jgi:hypothetical protein
MKPRHITLQGLGVFEIARNRYRQRAVEQPGTRAAYITEFYNAHMVYDKYAKHGGGGEGSRCADGVYLGSLVSLYFESACSLAAMAL